MVDKSFPRLTHYGAERLAFDLEGQVAQDLLGFPTIQAGSDGMAVNSDPPLFICGGVKRDFSMGRRYLLN